MTDVQILFLDMLACAPKWDALWQTQPIVYWAMGFHAPGGPHVPAIH